MSRKSPYQRQLARIHILRDQELNMHDAAYRAIVAGIMDRRGTTGRPSSAEMTDEGRNELIDTLDALNQERLNEQRRERGDAGGWDTWHGRPPTRQRYPVPGQPGMITKKQAAMIAFLEDEIQWTPTPARLQGFIRRQMQIEADNIVRSVRSLTNRQASTVITGLERMTGRSQHPRSKARQDPSA